MIGFEEQRADLDVTKLGQAYETIKDPIKRRNYDLVWAQLNVTSRKSYEVPESKSNSTENTTQEETKKTSTPTQDENEKEQERRRQCLRQWESQKTVYEGYVFEANRKVRKVNAELKRLQELDEEDEKKDVERSGWWKFLSSPLHGRTQESDVESAARLFERLQRCSSRRIKSLELEREEASLQAWKNKLQALNDKITAEKKEQEEENQQEEGRKQGHFWREEAVRLQVMREKMLAEQQRKRREAEAAAKEAQERLEKELEARQKKQQERLEKELEARQKKQREEQEELQRKWKEEEEARQKKKQEALEEAKRKLKEEEEVRAQMAAKFFNEHHRDNSFRSPAHDHGSPTSARRPSISTKKTPCQHQRFWPKIEGGRNCGNCGQYRYKFAFRCPDCAMVACADCRQLLRGEKVRKQNKKSSSGFRDNGSRATDNQENCEWDYYD
jgi:hypothetical protein